MVDAMAIVLLLFSLLWLLLLLSPSLSENLNDKSQVTEIVSGKTRRAHVSVSSVTYFHLFTAQPFFCVSSF